MKKLLTLTLLVIASITQMKASHTQGADITYTCLGGDSYEVVLTIYRDCAGVAIGQTQQNVDFFSSCGNFSVPLPFVSFTEVSQLCPTALSTCNGGTNPGTEQFIFADTVTLVSCSDWVMSWDLCCRNNAITNLQAPATRDLYVETTLNSLVAPCNNSPQFLAVPTPYICANNLTIYNHGASDIDGDSLAYSFNNPLEAPGNVGLPGVLIPFAAPATLLDPLITTSGMNLDPATGEMCFTPSQGQIGVIAILVEEFRNGVLIGSIIRELQVVVEPSCTNNNPTTGVAATCGGSGGLMLTAQGPSVVQLDQNSLQMCPGDSVCFDIVFSDPDGDNIDVVSNVAQSIPGATFTVANNNTGNPVGTFCWVPTPLDSGLNNFAVILQDDACPISGVQTFTYDITVFDQPFAGFDRNICENQSLQLTALGGGGYSWAVLNGDANSLSCTVCANPIITPNVTTTYELTSSLASSCITTDTVTITVIPLTDVTLPMVNDTAFCFGGSVDLDASPIYDTYQWSTVPPQTTQMVNISIPGTYILTVDTAGCILNDTIVVVENPLPIPTITPNNLNFCEEDSLTLTITNNFDAFQWFTPISSTNNSIVIQANSQPGIVVALQVTDSNQCIGDTLFLVNNTPLPIPSILGTNDSICPGDSVLVTGSPGDFASYLWSTGATTISTTVPSGNIQLTVTDTFGCEGIATATVNNSAGANASFTVTPASGSLVGTNVIFTDNSTGNIVSWDWDFGDGSFDNVQNPSHIYAAEGSYIVVLTVIDDNGCTSSFSINYVVENGIDPPIEIEIYNVITPNGDGINDFFEILNGELTENTLTVYNRWGRKVFEQNNYKNDWDASELSDGTYFYVFEAILDPTIGVQTFEGSMTLLK